VKIETQKTKFNTLSCKNKSLKDQINFLRREKKIFEDIKIKLAKEIETKTFEVE